MDTYKTTDSLISLWIFKINIAIFICDLINLIILKFHNIFGELRFNRWFWWRSWCILWKNRGPVNLWKSLLNLLYRLSFFRLICLFRLICWDYIFFFTFILLFLLWLLIRCCWIYICFYFHLFFLQIRIGLNNGEFFFIFFGFCNL